LGHRRDRSAVGQLVQEGQAPKFHPSDYHMDYRSKASLEVTIVRPQADGVLLVAVLLAAAVMAVAISVEQRIGPAAGGWVTALPLSFGVALVVVGMTQGDRATAQVAASAAEHVPAQVLFAVVFAVALSRYGLLAGGAAGAFGYLVASAGLMWLPALACIALAIPALALTPRLFPVRSTRPRQPRHWSATVLTCVAGSAVVLAAVLSSRVAGPAIGGAVAAFPTMSGTLTAAVTVRNGRGDGAAVLLGLVRSLPCYLTFCLVIAVTARSAGVASIALATLAGVVAAVLMWRQLASGQRQAAAEPRCSRPAVT
jgi:hypothetical protein